MPEEAEWGEVSRRPQLAIRHLSSLNAALSGEREIEVSSSESSNRRPTEGIAALRKRVTCLKEQTRRLFERIVRREISDADACTEYKRLEDELIKAEQQIREWEEEHRSRN